MDSSSTVILSGSSSSTVILSGSSTSSGLSTRSSSSVPDSSVPGIVHQDLQVDQNYDFSSL